MRKLRGPRRENRAKTTAFTFLRTPRKVWFPCTRLYRQHTLSLCKGKMPREAEISLNEREFIKQALQEQIRLDGRAFDAFRQLDLNFGDEYGVADVQLGKTRYAY